MEKFLRPSRLDIDANSPAAAKEWRHWYRTCTNFIAECGENVPDQFRTLMDYVSHSVYEYIEECTTYDSAIAILQRLYVKNKNKIFARHQRRVLLVSCVWQKKKKMGNRLYYWSRLMQTHDQLIERLLSNESRSSNGSERVFLDPFCSLIGWRSFGCWTRMIVRHVLRRSAIFKCNHWNFSYVLHLFTVIYQINNIYLYLFYILRNFSCDLSFCF